MDFLSVVRDHQGLPVASREIENGRGSAKPIAQLFHCIRGLPMRRVQRLVACSVSDIEDGIERISTA